jgi:hypothetical protein
MSDEPKDATPATVTANREAVAVYDLLIGRISPMPISRFHWAKLGPTRFAPGAAALFDVFAPW